MSCCAWFHWLPLLAALATTTTTTTNRGVVVVAADSVVGSYTYDTSWPVTSTQLSSELGNKQKLYDDFMNACKEALDSTGKHIDCEENEGHRLHMNAAQPSSVYNYTKQGYEKIKAPRELFDLIKAFYDENKHRATIEWHKLNTYHNMWDSPPTMVYINDKKFGGSAELQNQVWEAARTVMEEWTGQMLLPVSLYGVRLYHNGSILAPHVDRMPLVTSAIINVDQDVDEPWPLEVYGRDGKAVNITMEPGDMVLYESHSIIHGRPFPLVGNYYANIFIHFEPLPPVSETEPREIPPYLIQGSPWEKMWLKDNPRGYKNIFSSPHEAAQQGNVRVIKRLGKTNPNILHRYDPLGWLPLHEAVRAGHVEAVQIILLNGGDVNTPTTQGYYPLQIALDSLGEDHDMTRFLRSLGAVTSKPNEGKVEEL